MRNQSDKLSLSELSLDSSEKVVKRFTATVSLGTTLQ
jgi:hypothetical protein